jgi:hypothetical protein
MLLYYPALLSPLCSIRVMHRFLLIFDTLRCRTATWRRRLLLQWNSFLRKEMNNLNYTEVQHVVYALFTVLYTTPAYQAARSAILSKFAQFLSKTLLDRLTVSPKGIAYLPTKGLLLHDLYSTCFFLRWLQFLPPYFDSRLLHSRDHVSKPSPQLTVHEQVTKQQAGYCWPPNISIFSTLIWGKFI